MTFLDLPTSVPQFVDILFTKQDHDHELIQSLFFPLKDYDLLSISGTFTVELAVVADNANVQTSVVKFEWKAGNFDSLKALR